MENILRKMKGLEADNKKLFLLFLIYLIIAYLDFAFIMRLQITSLKSSSSKSAKIKEDINKLKKDLVDLQSLKNKQVEFKQGEHAQVKKILSEGIVSGLLQDISDVANKDKVKIMQIKPIREAKVKEDKLSREMPKFSLMLITLDLTGDYHDMGKFINDLENLENFLAVENLKIVSNAKNPASQVVNLTLKTYVKK